MINLNFRTLLYFRENLFKYSNSLISDTPRVGLRGMDFVLTRTLEIVIFYRPYTASNRYYNGSKVLTGNRISRCNYGRQTPSNLHKLLKIITF